MRNEKQNIPDMPAADEGKSKTSTQGHGEETASKGSQSWISLFETASNAQRSLTVR